ncbi:ThuA domain-containing protein [Streptomyces sp. DSM 44915]|uniref:ThuA domain-containing protein n=1 Tax=Streptomyces chisholmiae TaxID=3075540 RepID=A0ABU2JXJ0_9ACTN|nr:ThuA domain-containing protein [Streptomyces sp. DSM 44915]MDT0269711.1 ThuA domain-containing protein [Streptomyces sp. DSM 44915]
MRRKPQILAVAATLSIALLGASPTASGNQEGTERPAALPGAADAQVLVFHAANAPTDRTQAAVTAIESLGAEGPAEEQFDVRATDDPAVFATEELLAYNAVVFLSAEGAVLDTDQEAALQGYVQAGGGFLGVHDAATAQPESDWFTGLLGARPAADSPTDPQPAVVEVGDRVNPATADLPLEWERSDVWYDWAENPSGQVHTLARVREASYQPGPGAAGWDHPVSWCRDYDGGRSFYTGMGGTTESFTEADFLAHLRGALLWTSALARADCQATITDNYVAERITEPNQPGELDQIGEPHGLDIADDGRVFYLGRAGGWADDPLVTDWEDPEIGLGQGTVHVYDPATDEVSLAANLEVFGNKGGGDELTKTEEGLLGIALDPAFAENGHVYLYWMPHATIDRENRVGERRISRFTFDEATGTLELASEVPVLSWEAQIHSCCHAGGGLDFDSAGNLYIATGDNNSSGFSDGYSGNNPDPEFAGIGFADARRTSGNTNDLNGKILRIHPEPDGSYTVPEGNLFTGEEAGGGLTRPEIYVMGVRNPSRIAIDPATDWLYAGWVGPDAAEPSTTWGPAKYDTFAVITEAGNRGWPFCMGNNQPYRDRNLPDPTIPLEWYDCDAPRNESPHNDGLVELPPVTPNNIWYSPAGGGPDYPRDENGLPSYVAEEQTFLLPWLRGGGQATMSGPVYRHDAGTESEVAWPAYWDGKWFVGDHYDAEQPRHAVVMDPANAGAGGLPTHAESLDDIIPAGEGGIRNLMDWKFAPDGSLYVLDYGRGFFNLDEASALWRVTYQGGPATPLPDQLARR